MSGVTEEEGLGRTNTDEQTNTERFTPQRCTEEKGFIPLSVEDLEREG
jgi:hypothetical protein